MRLLASCGVLILALLSTTVLPQSPQAPSRLDINGDGQTDILWQDRETGLVAAWLMNGAVVVESVLLGVAPASPVPGGISRVRGTADLVPNGFDDVLFMDTATSDVWSWVMDAGGVAGIGPSLPPSDPLTPLRTAGDMDGDGLVDLVFWFNPIGAVGIRAAGQPPTEWVLEPGTPYYQQVLDKNWQIVAGGDFDRDGHRDILWWHSQGWIAVWQMNNTTLIDSVMLVPFQIQPEWRVAGAGDFDGDGGPDILWQSSITGQVALWLMDGMTLRDSVLVSPLYIPLDWQVVGPR